MKVCLRIIKEAKEYWKYIFFGMLAVVVSTIASLYAPWVMKKLTDIAIGGDSQMASKSLWLGFTLLGVYALQGVCSFLRGYLTHYGAYYYVADLRTKLYDKIQHLSLGYFNDKQIGDLVSRVMNDVVNAELLIAHVVPDLIIDVLTFIGVAIMLFSINVKLALISLISIPFLLVANIGYSKVVLPRWRLNSKAMGELSGALQENFSAVKEIQAFNQQSYETNKIRNLALNHSKAFLNATRSGELFYPFITFFSSVGTVGIIIFGGHLASKGEVSIGDIIGFIMYLGLFYQPITSLSNVNDQLHNAIAGCERVFEVIDEISDVKESENPKELKNIEGTIEFKNLTFHYTPEIPVLENINLKIKQGQTVALVGTTGVGKTTVASLVSRFYDPVEGSILIDDVDIKDVSLKSLRNNISMVLQDTFLFNGTIYENIVYGLKTADYAKVIEAAKIANAHEFIQGMENGYDTIIGERGVRLSGGQKQRISIARAVLRDTPILILDEATSSLDTKTEKEIQQALDRISKNRTTLVIAHRLSTIKSADQIIVLRGAGIIEKGTHDELVEKGGTYARFYASQVS
ncbi:ABC transporter ATP-binding protein [Tissierella praeacuta]|uniref:ABC transporter ATP-binding protein n=1 Tax=Tissierella praeacuta TaxID=43131 RepID=UPI00333E8ED3